VIGPEETSAEALGKMRTLNLRHLPVIENNKLIGVVSIRDLLLAEVNAKDAEIKWLTDYIHYVPPSST
jgi:CBS domain-containing protein